MKRNFAGIVLFRVLFPALAAFPPFSLQSVQAAALRGQEGVTATATFTKFTVTITPNPIHSVMQVTATGASANETLELLIYSKGGDVIYKGTMRITGPTTVKNFSRPVATPGLYYYRVIRTKNGQIVEGKIAIQ